MKIRFASANRKNNLSNTTHLVKTKCYIGQIKTKKQIIKKKKGLPGVL